MTDTSDDVTRRYHRDNPQSAAANLRTNKYRDSWRILRYVASRGMIGSTCDECEADTGIQHQTCSARFSDLKRDGLLFETSEKRKTRRGQSPAAVCTLTQRAIQLLSEA